MLSPYLSKQRNYIAWTSAYWWREICWDWPRSYLILIIVAVFFRACGKFHVIQEVIFGRFARIILPSFQFHASLAWLECLLTRSWQDHGFKLSLLGGRWTKDGRWWNHIQHCKHIGIDICNHYQLKSDVACYMEFLKSILNASYLPYSPWFSLEHQGVPRCAAVSCSTWKVSGGSKVHWILNKKS